MRRTILLGALASALLAGQAAAQAQASVETTGSAVIMDPARISQDATLSVADVARPKAGSTTATASGGAYTIVGQGGENYTISMPSTLTLVRAGGTEAVTLTLTPSQRSGAFAGAVGQPSVATIGVAGSVPISSTSAAGIYQGQFGVTLDYQ